MGACSSKQPHPQDRKTRLLVRRRRLPERGLEEKKPGPIECTTSLVSVYNSATASDEKDVLWRWLSDYDNVLSSPPSLQKADAVVEYSQLAEIEQARLRDKRLLRVLLRSLGDAALVHYGPSLLCLHQAFVMIQEIIPVDKVSARLEELKLGFLRSLQPMKRAEYYPFRFIGELVEKSVVRIRDRTSSHTAGQVCRGRTTSVLGVLYVCRGLAQFARPSFDPESLPKGAARPTLGAGAGQNLCQALLRASRDAELGVQRGVQGRRRFARFRRRYGRSDRVTKAIEEQEGRHSACDYQVVMAEENETLWDRAQSFQ